MINLVGQLTGAYQECKIKMTVESLSMGTVRLFAHQVRKGVCKERGSLVIHWLPKSYIF